MNSSIAIRENLHSLIDRIDNKELLEIVFNVLNTKASYIEGTLSKNLTVNEKQELYQSYDESLSDSNLTDLDELKKKHSKWLEE